MRTPILAGRDVSPADRAGAPKTVVVNETFSRKFFNGQNPVGKTFMIGFPGRPDSATVEIVGLVADAKYASLREPAPPTMYTAWAQSETALPSAFIMLRGVGAADNHRATVLAAMERVSKDIVVSFKTLDEDLAAATTQERLVATLSACFGGLALLLAAMGLYGTMSYSVARRRNEIGIRMALGAAPHNVMRSVLSSVAVVTGIGLVIGVTLAIATGRFVNTLLFGLVASDLTMVTVATLTLGAAAALAGYVPARRAARVDPMVALREQ
jgi:hypothetical protein